MSGKTITASANVGARICRAYPRKCRIGARVTRVKFMRAYVTVTRVVQMRLSDNLLGRLSRRVYVDLRRFAWICVNYIRVETKRL